MGRRFRAIAAALLLTATLVSCSDHPASHGRVITLTLIRHAQSEGNASGRLDTSVPGPVITAAGRSQAQHVADEMSRNGYDGIYASTMIRTQETAQPMSAALKERVDVLPGLREIEAGRYEGQPEKAAMAGYMVAPVDWLRGDRDERIPGSIDGNQFDGRFDAAVRDIYNSGDTKPVAFSHGAAIMVWTLMNVKNPDYSLLVTHPLPNTGHVVVSGDPQDGWTLLDWDGIRPDD
jgi:broad specificity phosphatase PhoE